MENQNKRLPPEVAAGSSDVNDSSGDVQHGEQPADLVAIRSDDRDIVMASDPGCSDRDRGIDGFGATGPRTTPDPLITTTSASGSGRCAHDGGGQVPRLSDHVGQSLLPCWLTESPFPDCIADDMSVRIETTPLCGSVSLVRML